ncbi:hypothetical protein KDW_19850 [Dictyobacter vulcani]|uniref:Helix-turn-helix domain-containing protein n=1 Tax=Dictyobacter vulcani TaxID=2607529 RepID=A0A5J4KJC1_9CHLR|nr:helix-turn-helix domain-containing protein [Dictyobacter vulcani]GER87823.1 hypothetical protein KDW_19850 [Dictyobacter vulcani]
MEATYYKPEEIMKLLSISRAKFYRDVEEGIIPSELEEGKRRGRKFPKEAIDAHIAVMRKAKEVKLTFGPTTNSELWAGYTNSRKIYDDEDVVDYQTLLEWRSRNTDIFMTAREGDERAGGITILPLAEEIIQCLIDDKIREKDIPLWSIRKWTDDQLSVYIPSISITHTGNKQRDAERGQFIIRNTIRWAYTLNKLYDIKNWYAIAASDAGRKIVTHLGFTKIAGKRDAYILDDMNKFNTTIKLFLEKIDNGEPIEFPPEKITTLKTKARSR